jgi:hypothetical protein
MPMEATPFAQEELAEATNLTDVPTVLPLPGLEMLTLAKAETANTHIAMQIKAGLFIFRTFLRLGLYFGTRSYQLKQRASACSGVRQDIPHSCWLLTSPFERFLVVSALLSGVIPIYTGKTRVSNRKGRKTPWESTGRLNTRTENREIRRLTWRKQAGTTISSQQRR